MKVSINWLKELVDIKDIKEVIRLLPLRTIALREVTDNYFELDMKGYNRADLLSLRGVAREIAAITNSKIKYDADLPAPDYHLPEAVEIAQVEDYKFCPTYCLAKVEELKVSPSKPEVIKKLNDCGIRSINNLADVTNLMMLEFGQPMHAFDGDKVKGQISVRSAKKGEKLLTLDGKIRELNVEDLVIADESGPIGLAGVMGGKETEVTDSTKTILLEAAIFDPITTRKTAQRHHLPSEASKRFQHGLSKLNLLQALTQALWIYEEMGGKVITLSLEDVKDFSDQEKVIMLTLEKVNSLMGIDISAKDVEKYLTILGFHLRGVGSNSWEVEVPSWRLDIDIEVDLIEEIARMYGYEKIPAKELESEVPEKIDQSLPDFLYNLKKSLADIGLTEVQTYSFFSTQTLQSLGFNESNREKALKVVNPISSETEYLRTFIWPNLIEVVAKNIRAGFKQSLPSGEGKNIAIFELGKIYQPGPKESYRLAIALMNDTDNPIEELLVILNEVRDLLRMQVTPGSMMKELETLFHPKRYANIEANQKVIGGLAEVHPRFLNQFGIDKRVAILEISIESIIESLHE